MDVTSYVGCALLAAAAGGAAGWCTVRRMLGGARRFSGRNHGAGTMRGWPGPGRAHGDRTHGDRT
ncbi:hypothetical protein, partial [Pseudonocardia sp. KRD291]|uniref:hypothetical protein n=1 Tax=Pseudonocardia sp. KRD291 TaxID=2792007 RepID=UPI001C4A71FB